MKVKICPRIFAALFSVAAITAAILLSSVSLFPQNMPKDSPGGARVRALNNSLLNLHGQMQQADANSARTLRSQAATVIAQRAAELANLIQTNPHEALTFAFSPELLADLAAKVPQSAAQLEWHATVTGPATEWISDSHTGSHSWWTMNAAGRYLYLHFAASEPRTLNPGEVLETTGVVLGSEMAVETSLIHAGTTVSLKVQSQDVAGSKGPSGRYWPEPLTAALGATLVGFCSIGRRSRLSQATTMRCLKQVGTCALTVAFVVFSTIGGNAQNVCTTTGVQNIIVILATFPGVAPPANLTPQTVAGEFFGASAPSVTTFWQEASYGATSATGDVFGWLTLNGTYSSTACQSLTAMQSDAIAAAAAAGANFQNYNRVVVIFPDVLGCGWSGLSSIGCGSLTTPSGTIQASSEYVAAADADVQVATHELGHGMGLHHASTRAFTDSNGNPISLGALGLTGTLTEYGDSFSTMGHCAIGSCPGGEYGAPHKSEILGWLSLGSGFQTVQASGTFVLQPYELPGGLKAIKVQRGTGNNAWLWVEYRQAAGSFDPFSFPSPAFTTLPPQPFSGALIHYEDATTGIHTHLLNYSPSDSYFLSPALTAGQSWSDPFSNVSISVLSATSSGLTVSVQYAGGPVCAPANPTLTASPADPSIYSGTSATYTLSITDKDSTACGPSTYSLGSSQPSNWSTSFSANSITLTPGQTTSVTMTKSAVSGTSPGTYAVDATASAASYTGSAAANVTVVIPPSLAVSVSVSGSNFNPPATVPINATVTNGGLPLSGASVSFTMVSPTGTSSASATTNSAGTATWNYKLNGKAAAGTYSVSAQTGQGSGSKKNAASTNTVSSSPVTFNVQ